MHIIIACLLLSPNSICPQCCNAYALSTFDVIHRATQPRDDNYHKKIKCCLPVDLAPEQAAAAAGAERDEHPRSWGWVLGASGTCMGAWDAWSAWGCGSS